METRATKDHIKRIEELENSLAEAEQLIEAIKAGEVDAFAFNNGTQPEIYTLQGGDYAYRVLVENFNEGALNLSEDGLVVYTNKYFHDLLGLSYDSVIGHTFSEFVHRDSRREFKDLFRRGLAGEAKGEILLSGAAGDVTVYVSLTSLYPTLPTVGMIVSDLREKKKHAITLAEKRELETEKKLIEDSEKKYRGLSDSLHLNLKERTAELQLNKNLLQSVFDSTVNAIAVFNAVRNDAGEVVDFRYAALNTMAQQEAGGNFIGELLSESRPRSYSAVMTHFQQVVNTGEAVDFEVPFGLGNRPDRWHRVKAVKLGDGVVSVTEDVTARKHAEEEIKARTEEVNKKNIRLEEMNYELEAFAYVSSHDLQEPLRKIKTFTELILEEETELSTVSLAYFSRITQAATRMQALITDLLSFARIGNAERKFEKIPLQKIVDDVKADLHEQIRNKKAVIEIGEMCEANVIGFQLRQLFNNLLINSLKFAKPGTPPHIRIASVIVKRKATFSGERKPFCHITISDNGIGFEPHLDKKIFEVFQQLHGKSEFGGTGIGLAIVKKIVDNHHGEISASGAPGVGATFDIYLPA